MAGSLPIMVPAPQGILTPALLEPWIQPDIYYCARTRMVVLEDSHNGAGGTVYPLDTLTEIRAFTRARGFSVHIDGARLFNAASACRTEARTICAAADTVTFCLSKGLGAPVGAMLCGTRDFIAEARRVRKMLGGGMRQAGIIAAAGLYALEHNVARLVEDHENARLIAKALASTAWARVDPERIATNIIYFDTPGRSAGDVVQSLAREGILCFDTGAHQIRFVTHLDLTAADAREVARIIQTVKI